VFEFECQPEPNTARQKQKYRDQKRQRYHALKRVCQKRPADENTQHTQKERDEPARLRSVKDRCNRLNTACQKEDDADKLRYRHGGVNGISQDEE